MTRRLLLLIALLAALIAPGQGSAQEGTGGNNTAVAINVKDGSSLFKFAFSIKKVTGEVVDNGNAAVAFASCENCRTTAIAIQIVLVSGSPDTVTPQNVAISINQECTSCQTFSTAFQFVLGVSDPSVGLTVEGKRQLREILREFRALKEEDYTLEEFHAKTQALGQRLRVVLQTELQSRRAEEDDDAELDVEEDEEAERPAPPAPPADTTTDETTTETATTESTPTATTGTEPAATTPPPTTTTP
jgi:putative peptide zinc metalloprotease protein